MCPYLVVIFHVRQQYMTEADIAALPMAKRICRTVVAAGRYDEAYNVQSEALEQARTLKARRYEPAILGDSAEVALSKALRAEALALARKGREISEETGPGFVGRDTLRSPRPAGRWAAGSRGGSRRRRSLARARVGRTQLLLVPALRHRTAR
jgi:hypothetical protein